MAKLIDEVGNKYGRLTVIEKVESPNKQTCAYWKCKCECGNEKIISGAHLRGGRITSCGCLRKEKIIKYNKQEKIIDLTGKTFGLLTVIQRAENIGEQPTWLCQCKCGALTKVIGSNLRKENGTRSCGCLNSKGELLVASLLKENQKTFEKQYCFADCFSNKKAKMFFDFAIFEKDKIKYLIEVNGRQHYEEVENFFHDSLQERQNRDNIKKKYCLEHKIPLIIIPYTQLNNLTFSDIDLETSNFIYKGD